MSGVLGKLNYVAKSRHLRPNPEFSKAKERLNRNTEPELSTKLGLAFFRMKVLCKKSKYITKGVKTPYKSH